MMDIFRVVEKIPHRLPPSSANDTSLFAASRYHHSRMPAQSTEGAILSPPRRRSLITNPPGLELNPSIVASSKSGRKNSKSKACTSVAMMMICSKYVMFLPMHALGPIQNGRCALATRYLLPLIHRSDMNSVA
jgi:hypothetical protein